MLFRSILSVALAAGSALALPVAVIQGGLHKRDHSILKARSNNHVHNLHVRQAPSDDGALWVTEISFVTVVVDQNGVPQTTQSGGTEVETIFSTPTASSSQPAVTTSVAAITSTSDAPIVSSSDPSLLSATSSFVSAQDIAAAVAQDSSVAAETTISFSFSLSSIALDSSSSPASPTFVSSTTSSVVETSISSNSFESTAPTSSVVESTSSFSSVVESSSSSSSEVESSPTTFATTPSSSVAEPSLTSTFEDASSSTAPSSTSTVSSVQATSSSTSSSGLTVPEIITYSPYNDDNSCKNADAVRSDLSKIAAKGIKTVRIYNTDCNTIQTVQPVARELGLTIDQGFWIGPQGADSIDSGVQDIINWVANENGNDWSIFAIFTVGNEAVFGNHIDAPTLLNKIKEVKSKLRAAGWNGSVTTAETPSTYSGYPELCTDSDGLDIIGVNAHPYFDAGGSASEAGNFINSQFDAIKQICGNNAKIRITETGYPSAGNTNGNQVPTKENQAIAIKQIMDATNNKAVMFTMYDDYWKNPGPYNVEQHFGIFDLF
ncbi:hypothetical protein D0Z03_001011 [Geotrichum reessii]|nr:hypothetical protein D0Z03_001011 [Galactomyces reessii]